MKARMKLLTLVVASAFAVTPAHGQAEGENTTYPRHVVGSSMFVLANLVPQSNPPSFYQLNYGYRLSPRDAISVEAITWTYNAPIGIPYGPAMGSADEQYPGHVREYGVGVAYQRFLWRDGYAALHALPLRKEYVGLDDERIQNGFRLFLTFRLGYQVNLFRDRFFLEPSVAFTHWPIDTNMPESFAIVEDRWPNYFRFEPGLHFGMRF